MIRAGDSIRVAVTTTLPPLPLMLTILTFLRQGQMALVYLLKPAQWKLLFIYLYLFIRNIYTPVLQPGKVPVTPTGHPLVPDLPLDSSLPVTAFG